MQRPSALSSLSPQNFSRKKFLILFPQKNRSKKISYVLGTPHFLAQDQKIKKSDPGKWNFLILILKNFLRSRKQKPQKNLYFFKRKLFYIPGKEKPEKASYISGSGNPKKLS